MNNDRELLQQALDALEHLQTDIEWQYKSPTRAMLRKVEKALRTQLAQDDPPCKTGAQCIGGKCGQCAQPEQEPVAWEPQIIRLYSKEGLLEKQLIRRAPDSPIEDYYPQREWVGLTDEEYEAIAEKHVTNCYFDTLTYARAIEAKLREKNT